jgi:hypothetical protein
MMRQKFDIGDLVEIALPWGRETRSSNSAIGLVTATRLINANMETPELYRWHVDEYMCQIRTLEDNALRWVRAKNLKTVSKVSGLSK